MATVEVKMSQAAWEQPLQVTETGEKGVVTLGRSVYALAWQASLNELLASSGGKAKISGGKVELQSADGNFAVYSGAINQDTSTSGTAVITSKTVNYKNILQETIKGKIGYAFQLADGYLTMERTGGQLANYKLDMQNIPGFSGKRSVDLTGDITLQADATWKGKIYSIEWSGEKAAPRIKISGDLDIGFIESSLSYQVDGKIDSASVTYADKSYLRVSGPISYSDASGFHTGMLADPLLWSGDDTLRLELPSRLGRELSINVGEGNDVVSIKGGGGYVRLAGGNGNDRFLLQDGLSSIDGGDGIDTIETASSFSLASASSVENLMLTGKANIHATGTANDNLIVGNAGKNILDGAGGNDLLRGGTGDDTYKVSLTGDVTIDDASGKDKLEISSQFAYMKWNGSTLEIVGYSEDGLMENTISILNANKAGAIETVSYPESGLSFRLSPNQVGSKANDLIVGTILDDLIKGLDGDDGIYGSEGNDVLIGGKGGDFLWGGTGADTFKLEKLTDSLVGDEDQLIDLEIGIDKIDLSSLDANARVKGRQTFTFSEEGPTANGLWFSDGDDFTLRLYGDVNGDAKADFAIVLVGVFSPLAASDFIGLA